MARVSYAFDGTMGRLGLQGKAIMPIRSLKDTFNPPEFTVACILKNCPRT